MIDVMLGPPGVAAGTAKPELRETRDASRHDSAADFSDRLKDASSPSTHDRSPRTAHDKKHAAGPAEGKLQKESTAEAGELDKNAAAPVETSDEATPAGDDATPVAVVAEGAPETAQLSDTVAVAVDVPTPLADEGVLPGVVPVSTPAGVAVTTETPEGVPVGGQSALTTTVLDTKAPAAAAATPVLDAAVVQAAGESGKEPAPPAATVTLTIATDAPEQAASAAETKGTTASPAPAPNTNAATKVPQAPTASAASANAPSNAPAMDGAGAGATGQTSPAAERAAASASAASAPAPAANPAPAATTDGAPSGVSLAAPSVAPATTRETTRAAGMQNPTVMSTPRQVAEDLGMRMQLSLREGGREVMLSLRPPELGHVIVKVSMRDGLLRAQVTADRPEAVKMLEQALPHLAESLSERGLSLQGMDISYNRPSDQRPEPSFTGGPSRAGRGEPVREADVPLAEVISLGPMTSAARLTNLDLLA